MELNHPQRMLLGGRHSIQLGKRFLGGHAAILHP
jgi:hypothetical protein